MRDQTQQVRQPEYPAHSGYAVGVFAVGHKKEEESHSDEQGVNVVPALHEEILRAEGDDPEEELDEEDPDEDAVEGLYEGGVVEHEEDGVDEGEDDYRRDDHLEHPVPHHLLQTQLLVHVPPEPQPQLDVLETRRQHGLVL